MKLLKYLASFAAVAGMLSACTTDLDTVEALPIENATPATIHPLTEDIVITADNQGEEVTFSWDAADFGVATPVNYSIWAAYADTEKEIFSNITKTSFTATLEQLNQPLYNDMKLPAEEPAAVAFRIGASIGEGYQTIFSESSTINVTVTAAEKRYPVIWVIGDYCSWDFAKAQNLYSFSADETNYEGFIDFGDKAKNGFKISGAAGWDDSCNWGTDGTAPAAEASSVQLINAGSSSDLKCYSKRFYKFAFSRDNLMLEVKNSFNQLGVVGGFTGWADGKDVVMNFNPEKRRFWADVENLSGEFKFRADGGWDVNWGADGSEGKLKPGGDNINVTEAGNYRVYAYLSNSEELRFELDTEMYGQPEAGAPADPTQPDPDQPVEPEVESGGKRIYLNNNDGWKATYLYTWNNDGTSTGLTNKWPGMEMTGKETIDGVDYVYYEMPATTDGLTISLIFNNNDDKQTSNIEGYKLDRNLYFTMTGGVVTEQIVEEVSFKLYAHSDAGWAKMYLWAWDNDGNNYSGGNWPGVEMTEKETVDGVEYFVYTLPASVTGKTLNFIFSNDEKAQTQNLEGYLIDKDLYFTIDANNYGSLVGAAPVPDVWAICGTVNNWGDTIMTETNGEWVVTDVSLVTTHEFKFRVKGGWVTQFGVTDGNVAYAPGQQIALDGGNNPATIKVSENGTYDIYLYPEEAVAYIMPKGQRPAR